MSGSIIVLTDRLNFGIHSLFVAVELTSFLELLPPVVAWLPALGDRVLVWLCVLQVDGGKALSGYPLVPSHTSIISHRIRVMPNRSRNKKKKRPITICVLNRPEKCFTWYSRRSLQ